MIVFDFLFLLMAAIPMGARWCLCGLTGISLTINDVENLSWARWPFKCLLWWNVYSGSLLSVFEVFVVLLWSFGSLHVLDVTPLSDAVCNYVLHAAVTSCSAASDIWYSFSFELSTLSIVSFVACAFGVIAKKSSPSAMLWSFCPLFFSKSFILLVLTFRCLIHFEFILYMV